LSPVRGAPEFLYPAYAVYSEGADMGVVAPALEGFRQVAAALSAPNGAVRRSAVLAP
jgi:hypothetical protein